MKKIGNMLGLLALVFIIAPLGALLWAILGVLGVIVKVVLWPTMALFGLCMSVLGGGTSTK